MISGLFRFKWLVVFLSLLVTVPTANAVEFGIKISGPESHTPSSPNSYGPIAKDDTLWSIAMATRPDSRLSIYQCMAAIVDLNPHAFLNGDINRVIDGSVLRIPSAEQIRATDGSQLQRALNKPGANASTKTAPIRTVPASKPIKPVETKKMAVKLQPEVDLQQLKIADLQDELSTTNEHLLLSSETNRRLKLQLESIRLELTALKEQIAQEKALRKELKAQIEQQKQQLDTQQKQLDAAAAQAKAAAKSNLTSWLLTGVASVLAMLGMVWLGLWLKNRNDHKDSAEDDVIFDDENDLDEFSDYLTNDNYNSDEPVASHGFVLEDELDFNVEIPDDEGEENRVTRVAETRISEPSVAEIQLSEPLQAEAHRSDNPYDELDLSLDNESTSFDNESVVPDVSWLAELDADNNSNDESGLIPPIDANDEQDGEHAAELAELDRLLEELRSDNDNLFDIDADAGVSNEPDPRAADVVNNDDIVDNDDIDSLLAAASLAPEAIDNSIDAAVVSDDNVADEYIDSLLAANASEQTLPNSNQDVDADDIDRILAEAARQPQASSQTVDEMLAELDQDKPAESGKNSLQDDDIEAMMAEYSPNAFSEESSEQAPIDIETAKKEEFIDIDKLLNEAGQAPADIADEPYDLVKLDVGLDGYQNTMLEHNDVDGDYDTNTINAQLDLARAYLEIGDIDGVRSMLEPLIGQGDAEQQAEVEKLLQRL